MGSARVPGARREGAARPASLMGRLGGGIILFEMLLWPRKSLWRGWRLGRTKLWMTAHIWLGLLTTSLAALARRLSFQPVGVDSRVRSHVASGPGGR